jgi:myo-inositol-1(or 4)-monophosphatase
MPNTNVDINDCIKVGLAVIQEAGSLLHDRFDRDFTVLHKGAINLVTDVDLAAEELIVGRIRKAFPTHSILAEEKHHDSSAGAVKWIIDPLDGTTNYAHGYPVFSISIGLEIDGEVEWGAVLDPIRDELYAARKGHGASCNGRSLSVSAVPSLDGSLLATGFPYDIRTSSLNNLENFCAFAVRTQGIRRSGSAAIDLCHVAAGCIDGFWELKLNPWDCAAGHLMIREAGGLITNFCGQPGSIYEREVIASNGLIHQEMIAILEKAKFESRS